MFSNGNMHGHNPAELKEVSNYEHLSLRNMIEWSFGVLNMKCHILLNLPKYLVNKKWNIIGEHIGECEVNPVTQIPRDRNTQTNA
jgi:hypothetical protein